nr:hypothetical protein [Tanacetum cinerariifolium]
MTPSIEEDDDDSERDMLIHEELLDNYSLSFPVNESFYFDIPSFSRPPAKPPDGKRTDQLSSPETSLVVPVFQKGDDPIDAINHMMSFLTSVPQQTTSFKHLPTLVSKQQ